jgi:REP element-mobilizing transposase RayT
MAPKNELHESPQQVRPIRDFEFLEPGQLPFVEIVSRGELPHLYKDGATYFVTFRLLYAVQLDGPRPATTCGESESVNSHTPAAQATKIAKRYAPPLRQGSGILQQPEFAQLTQDALRHFHGSRYFLSSWCIMPNHVHAIVTPAAEYRLDQVLHSWKSFTAHAINRQLRRRSPVWERESFDHMIRSIEDFDAFVTYIESNPVQAGLCSAAAEWPWSSARAKGS